MAIVQISRIQVRRGLHDDLPQLASGEFGWSLGPTTPRLWIGNGTIEEGAPVEGRTEILTEYTDFLDSISAYTFKGTQSGYTSQTGPSAYSSVKRTLQQVLDEQVSVKDFGAVGDGVIDDTLAIDRAIRQIYVKTYNNSLPAVRRVLRFPAGTYKITSNIVIPPNCTLVGEGKNNTIISSNVSVFQTCDDQYQISSSIGSGGAVAPGNITIRDMSLKTSSTSNPVAYINKATNVLINSVNFTGGSYNVTLAVAGNVEVSSSTFFGSTTGAGSIGGKEDGLISGSNYYETVRKAVTSGATTLITTLANGAGQIDYEISSGTSYRIGTLKYNRSAGVCSFDDDFTEPATSIGANLYAGPTGNLTCAVSSTSVIKYNIKQFI